VQTGFGWSVLLGDFHFRAVTSAIEGAPVALFSYDDAAEPLINFTDESTNDPTSWYWDFADGTTSTLENPVHNYLSNGSFNVCLTATNAVGSDTYCEVVEIDYYVAPVADFSFSGDPMVTFTDLSSNTPLSWAWDFGDGASSLEQNPVHTYAENGVYNVCLTASNAEGSSTECKDVTIGNTPQAPVADFTYTIAGLIVTFTDVSTNTPTSWNWNFGDGSTSTLQNPSHAYSTFGSYTVCLTATNAIGSDDNCLVLGLTDIDAWQEEVISVFPNPAFDYIAVSDADMKMNGSEWAIFNNVGEIVSTGILNGNPIPIGFLHAGIYFLRITGDESIGAISFVKN
jgi:PKD repeat protein